MLNFDSKGFLTPDTKLPSNWNELVLEFVSKFDKQTKRAALFEEFKRYFRDLFDVLGIDEIEVWVDGSFATRKENPNDIDFVFFLDTDLAEQFADLIGRQFTHPESKQMYHMDAFLLRQFRESHPEHYFTVSDKAYWHSLFSRTRKDRRGLSSKKGFIELKISRHDV